MWAWDIIRCACTPRLHGIGSNNSCCTENADKPDLDNPSRESNLSNRRISSQVPPGDKYNQHHHEHAYFTNKPGEQERSEQYYNKNKISEPQCTCSKSLTTGNCESCLLDRTIQKARPSPTSTLYESTKSALIKNQRQNLERKLSPNTKCVCISNESETISTGKSYESGPELPVRDDSSKFLPEPRLYSRAYSFSHNCDLIAAGKHYLGIWSNHSCKVVDDNGSNNTTSRENVTQEAPKYTQRSLCTCETTASNSYLEHQNWPPHITYKSKKIDYGIKSKSDCTCVRTAPSLKSQTSSLDDIPPYCRSKHYDRLKELFESPIPSVSACRCPILNSSTQTETVTPKPMSYASVYDRILKEQIDAISRDTPRQKTLPQAVTGQSEFSLCASNPLCSPCCSEGPRSCLKKPSPTFTVRDESPKCESSVSFKIGTDQGVSTSPSDCPRRFENNKERLPSSSSIPEQKSSRSLLVGAISAAPLCYPRSGEVKMCTVTPLEASNSDEELEITNAVEPQNPRRLRRKVGVTGPQSKRYEIPTKLSSKCCCVEKASKAYNKNENDYCSCELANTSRSFSKRKPLESLGNLSSSKSSRISPNRSCCTCTCSLLCTCESQIRSQLAKTYQKEVVCGIPSGHLRCFLSNTSNFNVSKPVSNTNTTNSGLYSSKSCTQKCNKPSCLKAPAKSKSKTKSSNKSLPCGMDAPKNWDWSRTKQPCKCFAARNKEENLRGINTTKKGERGSSSTKPNSKSSCKCYSASKTLVAENPRAINASKKRERSLSPTKQNSKSSCMCCTDENSRGFKISKKQRSSFPTIVNSKFCCKCAPTKSTIMEENRPGIFNSTLYGSPRGSGCFCQGCATQGIPASKKATLPTPSYSRYGDNMKVHSEYTNRERSCCYCTCPTRTPSDLEMSQILCRIEMIQRRLMEGKRALRDIKSKL